MKIEQKIPNWEEITRQADLSALLRYMRTKLHASTADLLTIIEQTQKAFGHEKTLSILVKAIKGSNMELESVSTHLTSELIKNIEEI